MPASFGATGSIMSEMFFLFIVFAIFAVANQFLSESRKQRNDRIIGRERNDAFRDVANARLTTGDNEFDDKKSQLENAELQIALSTLNDRLQLSDQQREDLEQRYAQVMEQLAELKAKPPAPATSDAVVGSLGDANIIEEPSLDSSEIVFDEHEQLES